MNRPSDSLGRKISHHMSGVGTVTREMVEKRAREIATINGREPHQFTENDWLLARRELTGMEELTRDEELQGIPTLTRWDEAPGSTGHQTETSPAADEQTVAEELVQQGVDEAGHDQMVEGVEEQKRKE